ncbi:MAG: MmcQ/YjbR family DNA-binding protein [Oscillospiraceae bacterium]|nr:MmcQ/YjbR family DNA-binding protein [Oscillospiraceae bacterium]
MTIEEKAFQYLRFVPEKMTAYGFTAADGGFRLTAEFMDGAFRAELTVSETGEVSGKVTDTMNDEEYIPLRIESSEGTYVKAVRYAYAEWLERIAAQCCRAQFFAGAQANRITQQIREVYGIQPDFPWEGDRAGVFRHTDTRKWFGLIMHIRMKNLLKNGDETPTDVINLKILPEMCDSLTTQTGIFPAYHMNHRNWITVLLNDTLTDAAVMQQIAESFRLTDQRTKKS